MTSLDLKICSLSPATSSQRAVAAFLNSSSVYGGQRDLDLIVESGGSAQIFITTVADNKLTMSSPNSANGYTIYQLDGVDDSVNIDENGLDDFDATFGGSATAFQITGAADVDTHLNMTVYTSTGVGKYHLTIPSSTTETDYFILYSSFSGSPNFASVGAIEIFFDGSSDVDSSFSFFGIVGGSSDQPNQPESSQTTANISPQSPQSPVSSVGSPATAKGNSHFVSSDDSSAVNIFPFSVLFVVALLLALC
jgi:hypothetical protein